MLNLDPLFDAVDLTNLVRRAGSELRKTGRGYAGKCPFHDGDGDSFSVYEDGSGRQRWHCFSVCNTGGDIFDFVARWQGLTEFVDQLQWLADYAHIPLERLGWNAQSAEEHAQQGRRADLLTRAATFFQKQLWHDAPRARHALEYARSRGFSDAHLQGAGWGWAASDNALYQAMRQSDGGADPVRQAMEIGLIREDHRDFTANRDGDTVSPDGWLIYPHRQQGKTVYLSARAVSKIEHGSKARNLPGPKMVYRVYLGIDGNPLPEPGLVIVEGQADAEALRAWGWAALALCGCSIREENNPALVAYLRRRQEHGPVYIALSNDEAGERGTERVAELLDPTVYVVRWPKPPGAEHSDANECLQQGWTAADVRKLFNEAPVWMSLLLRRTERQRSEKNLRDVVAAFARLNVFAQSMWKREIVRSLDLTVGDFDAMLRASGADIEGDLQQSEYCVRSGMLCLSQFSERGRQYRVLSNFDARIVRDVVEDDGEEQLRYFAIAGRNNVGHVLHEIEVEASEFSKLGWALASWGSAAQIAAGSSTTDHLRAAIQALSENVQTRYVYSHLGWRRIDGVQRYLTSAGAVDRNDVQVRVINDLERYRLPASDGDLPAAIAASLRFLDTGDHYVTIPILASMYLAPLSSIVPPSFTTWLFGTTGSFKSTVVALAMCHFGKFAYNTPPASWSGTTNALEKKAFLVKDAPLWIDDYTAQSTITGMREMKRKSDQLLRDWGNRSGRSRMRADLKLRRTFVPRGLILSTAEQLPPGPSIIPRLFAIEIKPDMMTHGPGSALTEAQAQGAALYGQAMVGYVQWLSAHWEELTKSLPGRQRDYTDAAREQGDTHMRMPGNVGTMMTGWATMLDYFRAAGALDEDTARTWHDIGWAILLRIGNNQHTMVVEENPVDVFLNSLRQIFAQGRAYLRHRKFEGTETPDQHCWPQARAVQCEMIGWYDELYWYMLPQVAFNVVTRFCRDGGTVFPDTSWGLRAKLAEKNILLKQGDRFTYRMPFDSSKPRVWRLHPPLDDDTETNTPSPRAGNAGNSGKTGNE